MISFDTAALYHAHHSIHPDDLEFWSGLAQEGGSALLELGCGTGRVLLPLAHAGCEVIGMDNDPQMLAYLRQNWPAELGEAPVLQADFTNFHLGRRFDLVILPCNTYSTLDAPARQALLRCVAAHLNPGGRFAVSMPSPALLRELPARGAEEIEETFPHPLDGEPVQVSSGWRRLRHEVKITWHYDHLLPDGAVQRHSLEVRHRLTALEQYLGEFAEAGLPLVVLYGDYDRSDFDDDSPQLIIVALRA